MLRKIFILCAIILLVFILFKAVEFFIKYSNYIRILKVLNLIFIPTMSIIVLIGLASILEDLSIMSAEKRIRMITIGTISEILYYTSFLFPVILTPDFIFRNIGLSMIKVYVVILIIGIIIDAIVLSLSLDYVNIRHRSLTHLRSFIMFVFSLPLIIYLARRVVGLDLSSTYMFATIPLLSFFAENREQYRTLIYSFLSILIILILLLLYFFYFRSILISYILSIVHNKSITSFVDAGIISLLILLGLGIVFLISGHSEKPLILEIVNPFEAVKAIRLDNIAESIINRLVEFVRTGNKKFLICTIAELGIVNKSEIDLLEKAIDIVIKYEDIKPPTLAPRWYITALSYRNYSRRLALIYAVINILRGREISDEELERISRKISANVPRVYIPGIVSPLAALLIPAIIVVSLLYRIFVILYVVPLLLGILLIFSDIPVLIRRLVARDFIDTYKNLTK